MPRASVTLEWFKVVRPGREVEGTALSFTLTVNGHTLYRHAFRSNEEEGKAHGAGSRVELEVDSARVLVAGGVMRGFAPPRDSEEETTEQPHVVTGTYVLEGPDWQARYHVAFT